MISVHFQGKPFNITVIQVYALTSNAEEAERFYDLLELTPPQKCPFHYRESERKKESEVSWSCPTLCDPMDCSLSRSFVHGIFQARVLEWDAISFSRGSSQPRDGTWVSHIVGRRFTIWATREVHYRELECKSRKSRNTWINRQIWPWCTEWKGKG